MSYVYPTKRHSASKRRLASMVALILIAPWSGTHASGVPVVDGAHIGVNKFAWIEQYRQMYQELQRQMDQYRTQIRELEQKYVRGP